MSRLLPVLLLAWTAGCARPTRFVPFSQAASHFSASVPSDWTAIENPAGGDPGVQLLAPDGPKGLRPYISVDFHPASLDSVLQARTWDRPGRSQGPVSDLRVGGLAGKGFISTQPLPQSPESAAKGDLRVRTVLLPGPEGTYELSFAAPAAEPDPTAFQRFLDTFRQR